MKNEEADNEEKMDLVRFSDLPIRQQNTVLYEELECVVIPTLDHIETVLCMILEILGDDEDE